MCVTPSFHDCVSNNWMLPRYAQPQGKLLANFAVLARLWVERPEAELFGGLGHSPPRDKAIYSKSCEIVQDHVKS